LCLARVFSCGYTQLCGEAECKQRGPSPQHHHWIGEAWVRDLTARANDWKAKLAASPAQGRPSNMGKRKAEGDAPKSSKKEKTDDDDEGNPPKTYAERLKALSKISTPLADEKLTKKLHKLVKRASQGKALRRGVKEVVKSLRQGTKGLCILAGDVSPVDVIAHLPVFCEEMDVPYIFVPSKQDLGYAALTKRPTSVVLVAPKKDTAFEHQDLLDKAISAVGGQ